MLLTVTYPEIQEIIRQKTQKDIRLSALDRRTVCVSAALSLPLIGTREVKVRLALEDINNDYALLSYHNGMGVDLVITAVLKYFEIQSNVSFVQGLPDNRVKIQLGQIPQLQKSLKAIELQNMTFTNENASIEFTMK